MRNAKQRDLHQASGSRRDVVAGNDPREAVQDGFDVKGCWTLVEGTYTRTCFNGGGYDQNIYGNTISIP